MELAHMIVGDGIPVGQPDRLEAQVVLSLNSTGQQGFCVAVLMQNFFVFGELQSLLLRPSSDWISSMHAMKNNLLYSQSTDLNLNLIQKEYLQSDI